MTTRALMRGGLVILAALQALIGVWALLAPRSFFDDFPLTSHAWVALLPPYNEHLVRDEGAFSLALTVVLGAAAVTVELRLVRIALVTLMGFAVPHAIFHVAHLEGFPTADAVAQTTGLLAQLTLTLGLFALTWRLPKPETADAHELSSRQRG